MVTISTVTLILLGPPGDVRGQDRKLLSPEVTREQRIVFRLPAPNAKSVQIPGDFTAKTHDMTRSGQHFGWLGFGISPFLAVSATETP